ncbi:PfaD family polyunsaturated fatty acid/polyketide biosynthesis protein [Azospirillum sp. TSH100]|nr:PfaD family polyunsaturated fatty acid/polyketide biosynthesis protein [Azospirillum sp. TSH100]
MPFLDPGVPPTAIPTASFAPSPFLELSQKTREPLYIVRSSDGRLGASTLPPNLSGGDLHAVATLPPLYPEWLGDRAFQETHGCRFAYVAGEMARGIATPSMAVAAARAGLVGFYGSAGLSPQRVHEGIAEIQSALGTQAPNWGANLIHSPNDPALETAVCRLFQQRGVRRVSASAFMALTPLVVELAAKGLSRDPATGTVRRLTHIFAKVSRAEVARQFMTPAPQRMLADLVAQGILTAEEAELATTIPVAEDITVEADSGGHTDNRPLSVLFPIIQQLRDELVAGHGYGRNIRVGAAGGLGTPAALAGAFAMGAAYVVVGSVNQSAAESGQPLSVRRMLAELASTDVTMAPAADMFEMGVKVQVMKRGTMFPFRAQRLYDLYCRHSGLDDLPATERAMLERDVFQAPLEEIWRQTREHFTVRDQAEVTRAEADPRHRMALVFRWYLFNAARWPMLDDATRRHDFQVWCGPAMGAFNDWVKGSFLQAAENRTVEQIARNLLEGAAVVTRAQQMRTAGLPVPAAAFTWIPRRLA